MHNQNKVGTIVIVGGVPGVGKTTVINETLRLAKNNNFPLEHIVYGTVMMDIAKSDYDVENRDQLRKLPPLTQKAIQRQAAKKIASQSIGKTVIVDTHFAVKTKTGAFLVGIPRWVVDELPPQLLVLIETKPRNILKRRGKDVNRHRDKDSIDLLHDHQDINRAMAAGISQQTGSLLTVVENYPGKAREAAENLLGQIQALIIK
ncbi:MAG: adenylate kinase [Asgard group archaeon]|nr:adenylate kinase [Asgard group archaeon]